MITLKISFLLAIKATPDRVTPKKRKISQSDKKSKKSGKSKSLKNRKTKTKRKSMEVPIEDDPNYPTIRVEAPISYIHIEYSLFEKKFKYSADVVCWGPVAKIFTKCGEKAIRTTLKNDLIWVPICLEHYLQTLPTEEIRKMIYDVIPISVKFGKKCVGAKAKSEKTRTFFENTNDTSEFFPVVFSKKPDPENDIKAEMEGLIQKMLTFPVNQEVLTWMHNTNEIHGYKIEEILRKRFNGEDIISKDFHQDEKPKKAKKKSKTKKKSQKGTRSSKSSKKGKVKQNFDLKIPSYVLLTDPKLATYRFDNPTKLLSEFYIMLSSSKLLSVSQKLLLCPFVVKIRKICNLPVESLTEHGICKIFATCTVPDLIKFDSHLRAIAPTVIFNESRIVIGSDFPEIKILELLQTRRVAIEIFGVKEETNLLLARAFFNLSSLAESFYLFKEKAQCCNLESFIEKQNLDEKFFIDRFSVNEAHFSNLNPLPFCPILSNSCLLENGTVVKLEANFFTHTYAICYMRNDNRKCFRRLLVIFFKEEDARRVVTEVILHNQKFFGINVLLPNLLLMKKESRVDDCEDIISGFFIDHKNSYLLFIEGFCNGFILNVIYQISGLDLTSAKVFYNSTYNFEERLYKLFYNHNGLLFVIMKMSFDEIFTKQLLYIEGNVPIRCFRTIQKFFSIFHSKTLKTILNCELLPTEAEFLSFLMEFGLQIQYRDEENVNQLEE